MKELVLPARGLNRAKFEREKIQYNTAAIEIESSFII
jgi:hypothetical protein